MLATAQTSITELLTCFKQALMVLEKVHDDTGIDRERVMEKLSDATLAMKRQQSELKDS